LNVLVLNSSYLPAGVIGWKKSIKLLFMNKADILEPSDYKIRGINRDYVIPDVIKLKYYNNTSYTNYKYCRANIYKRDKYRCRYCNKSLKVSGPITIDHVIPKSRGGKDTWENTVTSCIECNSKKGDLTPEEAGMKLTPGSLRPTYFINLATLNPKWTKYLPIA
jgi:5-methylcytosine-specific restriction endonuclease McrA